MQQSEMNLTLAELIAMLPRILSLYTDERRFSRHNGHIFAINGCAHDGDPFHCVSYEIAQFDCYLRDNCSSVPFSDQIARVHAAKQEPILLFGSNGWRLFGVRPADN
jgi:hypothetical protein